jgi:hypothetical protein
MKRIQLLRKGLMPIFASALCLSALSTAAQMQTTAPAKPANTNSVGSREATQAITTRKANSVKQSQSLTPAVLPAKAAVKEAMAPADRNKGRRLPKKYDDSKTNNTSKH